MNRSTFSRRRRERPGTDRYAQLLIREADTASLPSKVRKFSWITLSAAILTHFTPDILL